MMRKVIVIQDFHKSQNGNNISSLRLAQENRRIVGRDSYSLTMSVGELLDAYIERDNLNTVSIGIKNMLISILASLTKR